MGTKPDQHDAAVAVLDRVRANPTGRLALRIGIGAAGALVIALGIVLIPFPGPGWAIVILGLAIWAVEFAWARSLLQFTRRQVRSWTRWVGQRSLPVRALIGVCGLIVIAAAVWASVRLSLGVDLVAVGWDWLARR
jgi:uncharacterized protein (TIGR02611 family)